MTNIRQLLAFNIKKNRQKLELSQAKLAEKANLSTQYLAMIELTRKFPSPEKLEQIAHALELDTPELFSLPPSAKTAALKLQRSIIIDLEKSVDIKIHSAIKTAVSDVVSSHLNRIENTDIEKNEDTERVKSNTKRNKRSM